MRTFRKLSTEKSQTDGYYILLLNYMHSSLRDSERYFKISSNIHENDFQCILKQQISKLRVISEY